MKAQTKGNQVIIDFGGRRSTFTAGGRKRYMLNDGIVMVNGGRHRGALRSRYR